MFIIKSNLYFSVQGKLIKLYSKQLVTKSKLPEESLPVEMRQCPSLSQWLRVVGLTPESIQVKIFEIKERAP